MSSRHRVRSAFAIACAVGLAHTGAAGAGSLDAPDHAGPIPDPVTRAELGPAIVQGWLASGPVGNFILGVDLHGGLRHDRWAVIAHAGAAVVAPPGRHVPIAGDLVRLGGDVRYSLDQDRVLSTTKHGRPIAWVRADLWVGAGLGYEWIGWRSGGGDHRADAALEIGYSFLDRGDDDDRYQVLTFGLAMVIARAPTSKTDPVSAAGVDHSVLVTASYTFGS